MAAIFAQKHNNIILTSFPIFADSQPLRKNNDEMTSLLSDFGRLHVRCQSAANANQIMASCEK